MRRFENQVAIVTGGAEGIGKAVALRLANEGCRIALLDLNENLLSETVNEFASLNYLVKGIAVDISKEQAVREAVEDVEQFFGKIDIMVNCAGIVGPSNTRITAYELSDYDKVYDVNLKGSFLMTKYSIIAMEKHNYGRILLMSSIGGKEGNPFMCGYASSKSGVMGLVKGVGKEYAKTGITINGLAPGVIKTAMNANTAAEQLEYMVSKIPMGRLGTVEEVAAMAAWVVSKESSFNTGFIFDLSGGRATY